MYNNAKSKHIFAEDVFISNNSRITGINNSDILVEPAGSGKSRAYGIPHILHTRNNLIAAGTKRNLCRLYGERPKEKGCMVMHLDFADMANTPWGYNSLAYIREWRGSELRKARKHNLNSDTAYHILMMPGNRRSPQPKRNMERRLYEKHGKNDSAAG